MSKSMLPALMLALAIFAAPMAASAHQLQTLEPSEGRAVEFEAEDYAFAFLLGDVGLVAGGLAGGAMGLALAGGCQSDPSEGFGGGCFLHGVGHAALGATIGGTLTSAGAIYGYGELSGHDGSFLATLAGTSLGTLTAFGIGAASDESAVAIAALFVLPSAAGTFAYAMSNRVPDEPTSGALVDVSPGKGARVSMPAVGVAQPEKGEYQLSVTLLGGNW